MVEKKICLNITYLHLTVIKKKFQRGDGFMKNFNFLKTSVIIALILSILAVAVYAVTLFNSPTTCSGQWSSCANAFGDNANRATAQATNTVNRSGIWRNYGLNIPSSAQINSVIVRADFFASTTKGRIDVRVSGDNGATYGASHIVGGNTAEQTFLIDVSNDIAWTSSKLNNANFRVNATCFKSSSGGTNPTCRLDWIPVNVTYTPFDFQVSAIPSSDTVTAGNNATSTVLVDLLSGNTETVYLVANNCPANATCSFAPFSGLPSFNSTFTVATGSNQFNGTPTGVYNISIRGIAFGSGIERVTNYILTVN